MPRVAKRLIIALVIVAVALVGAGAWYVGDYYHADAAALAATEAGNGDSTGGGSGGAANVANTDPSPTTADGSSPQTALGQVSVQAISDKATAFVPEQPRAGFIFYPGAKVQPEAYAPLMRRCAEQGILCVLIKPTFNLAILDLAAADGLQGHFPAVERWYIGGHSLGGVVASQYAADHPGAFDAVVLLASYSTADLSDFKGRALLVVGSNDQVLNREKYEEAKTNLPASARELVIDGGNHAQFGNYGEQAGDGAATISAVDQQSQTAAAIANL